MAPCQICGVPLFLHGDQKDPLQRCDAALDLRDRMQAALKPGQVLPFAGGLDATARAILRIPQRTGRA